jgi:integrase
MGTVYKKMYTKSLPPDVEKFARKGECFARWTDGKGRKRTAAVTTGKNGSERIVIKATTYTAKYRDGSGHVLEVATGCRDETAARSVLAGLVRRAELVKAGVMTKTEDTVADHLQTPIEEHLAAHIEHLRAKGVCNTHREDRERYLRIISDVCGFHKLIDLEPLNLEHWLAHRRDEGKSARSHNAYRAAIIAFCNWCIETNRLSSNPFKCIIKANEKADPRRQRRALTEEELIKLLEVARRRPLLDAKTVRRGKRKGQPVAVLREETQRRLELLGWERALIYKTLVLTGLRRGELASLTVGQLDFDGPVAYATLGAADEKARRGAQIPLRADLVIDLQQWNDNKLEELKNLAAVEGEPIPTCLPVDTPLFTVPSKLVQILNRDLKLAGIPKQDDRGRTVDVHALRHSFGTHLSKGGVAPRTAQAAMRHASIDLTMNVYTDPRLLDVAGALDVLPSLPLGNTQQVEQQKATGTDGRVDSLAPMLAPNVDNSGTNGANADKTIPRRSTEKNPNGETVSRLLVNSKTLLTKAVNRGKKIGVIGFEPTASCSQSRRSAKLSYTPYNLLRFILFS